MLKLFSGNNKKFLSQINKPEKELNKFICENWKDLFPNYYFITDEFHLNGNVRSNSGTSGRIDILGFNLKTKRFIIFELKKDCDRNIRDQAADYRDYIQNNFPAVYLIVTEEYGKKLPKSKDINKDIEIILIAKKFSTVQIERAKENNITLIKYYWFENDLIFIDYLNDEPDNGKIETANTKNKKINKIKNVISSEKEGQGEIDKVFGENNQSKTAFIIFLKFLESNGQVNLNLIDYQRIVFIRIKFNNTTFSIFSRSGNGDRKAVLLVMTNIDVTALSKQIIVDDRYRGEVTRMKGSYGRERFKVYFRNDNEVKEFCNYIKDKDFQPLQKLKRLT